MKTAVEVRFHSSHRRSVFPRALVIDGKEILVEAIVRHEVREDYASRRRQHVFVCSVQERLWEVVHFDDDSTSVRVLSPIRGRPKHPKC
jgi:hypothetical protein